MANPTLPSDIITDILSRLPSKPLIRFKSVSKQWYSLINSPNFINLHLTKTLISQKTPNLLIAQYSISSIAISDESDPNFYLIEFDHPLKHQGSSCDRELVPKILGSINGVVCISSYNKDTVVLYNPSTKTHRFVPSFTPSPYPNPYEETDDISDVNVVLFGFGFDSVSGDYKLLRMIVMRKESVLEESVLVYCEASVYSLGDDSWKCVNDQLIKDQSFIDWNMGALVDEVLHFISFDSNRQFVPNVVCFNLRNEAFSIFDLPMLYESFSRRSIASYAINQLGGCLCLMNSELKVADLWVMKEYGNKASWSRLFSIYDPAATPRTDFFDRFRPVVYSGDKKRLLLELREVDALSFTWYSLRSETFEKITVHGWPSGFQPYKCYNTWTFVDSLVSVVKDKVKLKPMGDER